ncbi:MATE family efflux transporter [Dyadobacter sp. 676]|uniref:MATE family efflux transporter n=1 Tax=Dyadobacter sp. 676 TaxID=3088362 RepID=A0AAU8FF70_9BACT
MSFVTNTRSLTQYRNIIFSLLYKGGALLASLLMVPLSLSFLSESAYGTWLVIYSVLSWTTFFDFGLGNGLKNKLSEALALDDAPRAVRLVSTHYVILLLVVTIGIGIFSAAQPFINWHRLLNVDKQQVHLKTLIWICLTIFGLKLVLDSIHSVLLAFQKAAIVQLNGFLASLLSLAVVFGLSHMEVEAPLRLPLLGILVTMAPALLSLGFNIYFFSGELRTVRPSLRQFHPGYIRDLFSLGGQFFVIQIAALVIYSTDNILISRLFSPKHVTVYNVAYKLFSTFNIAWNLIIAPYWVAFGEAYVKRDYAWIKKAMTTLLYFWALMNACLLLCLHFSDQLYRLWVGQEVRVPADLSASMALFVSIAAFSNIFAYFVNGLGKIRVQLIVSTFSAAINIPLAILLSKTLGLKGIVLATCICLAISATAVCLQYFRVINQKAKGVWNR